MKELKKILEKNISTKRRVDGWLTVYKTETLGLFSCPTITCLMFYYNDNHTSYDIDLFYKSNTTRNEFKKQLFKVIENNSILRNYLYDDILINKLKGDVS